MGHSTIYINITKTGLLFMLALVHVSALAQVPAAVMEEFNPKGYRSVSEKVYLHLNQDLFLPGETLHFNAYLLNGVTGQPSGLSNVLYVAIHDATGSLTDHFKLMGENGLVQGSYTFPGNLPPGNYTVTAYTRWMEQFDPFTYYQTSVRVVDEDSEPIRKKEKGPELMFFPEGGALVAGLTSKVALVVEGPSGNYTGEVYNENDRQVATVMFQSIDARVHTGQFVLKPSGDEIYRLRYRIDSANEKTVRLPEVKIEGAVLSYHGASKDNYQFVVKANNQITRNKENQHYLLVRKGGALVSFASLGALNKNGSLATFPFSELPAELLEMVLVNSQGKRLSTRWFMNDPSPGALQVTGLNQEVKTRENISLNLAVPEMKPSTLTVSVTDRPMNASPNLPLVLAGHEGLMGNRLMTTLYQKDPDFWLMCLPDGPSINSVPTEAEADELEVYIKLKGQITDTLGNKVAQPLNIMAYSTIQDQLYAFEADEDGSFAIPVLFNHTGKEEFSYQIDTERDDLMMSFYDSIPDIETNAPAIPIPSVEVIETMLQRREIEETYAFFEITPATVESKDEEKQIFYVPDFSVDLNKYVRVPNLKEVIREYVNPASVRRRKGKDYIRIFNKNQKAFYPKPALLFIDGHPVYDMEKALNIPMKDLERLDVLQEPEKLIKYAEGPERGVIFIYTRGGDFTPDSDRRKYVAQFEGLSAVQEAEMPEIEEGTTKPFFRSQLLWEPALKTDSRGMASVAFQTSDATGTYYLTISGVTKDGEPIYYSQPFEVKYSPAQ